MSREPRRFARLQRSLATTPEDILWQALRGRRLAGLKFRRQEPISPYTVDFLCSEEKLIVEVDGPSHAKRAEYDARRDEDLERIGFCVLRVSADDVLDRVHYVLAKIRAAAKREI